MARKTIQAWIDEALSDNSKAPLTEIILFHMRGIGQVEVYTWKPKVQTDVKETADLFCDKAHAYAQDLAGIQMFVFEAFYGKSQCEAKFPYKVIPDPDAQTSGLETEPPTESGRVQQGMRWAEKLQDQVYRRQQVMENFTLQFMQEQGRDRQSLMATVEMLMRDRMDAANLVVQMMTSHLEGQHRIRMEELQFERDTQTRTALMKMAPPLVNSLTGRNIFPQATADTALIETIAAELNESHLQKLLELGLPDTITGPLAQRLMEARQKKVAEESAKRSLSKFSGSAEDEVTGKAADKH